MNSHINHVKTENEDHDVQPSYKLGTAQVSAIIAALDNADVETVKKLCEPLHHADLADLIEWMGTAHRFALIEILGDDFNVEALSDIDDNVREEIIEKWGHEKIALAVTELDSDDAVDLITDLDEKDQRQVLDAIPAEDRTLIEESLKYPEDSAGRLMQREVVTVPEFWGVGDTIDFLRESAEHDPEALPETFFDIYVVDPAHKPTGAVGLSRMLRSARHVNMNDIMWTDLHKIPVTADKEDVAHLFRQRDLVSAPVIDDSGRLVGAITVDDVVDVIDDEHEEDMMLLAGVGEDDLYDAAIDTTRSRFSWLFVNLITAGLASIVIGFFAATIEQIVALAILMPIVASMGGNAGTQSLTVAVRGLATKELNPTNAMRVISKEVIVGFINGTLFAFIAGIVTWLWFGDELIGLVIAMAMVINMIVASLAGVSIPIMLERANIDPAIASSVFVTTVTDIIGFLAFLGLAALILI